MAIPVHTSRCRGRRRFLVPVFALETFALNSSMVHLMTMLIDRSLKLTCDQIQDYEKHGFLVLKGVFDPEDMQVLLSESNRLLREHNALISPNNLRCRYMPHHETGERLFEVFDPVNDISPVCQRFCFDPRILSPVASLYGEPACLFKEKLIFKPPGALGYQLHQDIPREWKGFPKTFLTVLIPIDPSLEENGCTEVFSGYHHEFLSSDENTYILPDDSVDVNRRSPLILNPGDIAIFHGLTPHKSSPNRSNKMRRVFYVSYNAQSDGGDQHDAHYAEFRERLRAHRRSETSEAVYYE